MSSLLVACATRAAPDFSGRWRPVNHYASTPQTIPLYDGYVFYAAPLDRTLKGMLERWAHDSRMHVRYEDADDFTLYAPVSQLRTSDLHQAVTALSTLYAGQYVAVTIEGNAIVVRDARLRTGAAANATSRNAAGATVVSSIGHR